MNAHIFDIVVLVIIGISAVSGLLKGLITMLSSLLALLLGVWLSIKFSYVTGDILQNHFTIDGKYVTILSFIITFIIVVLAVHMLGKSVGSLVKAISLGFVDKILGVLFGVLKSAFIISVIIAILNSFAPTSMLLSGDLTENSLLYGIVQPIAPFVFRQLQFNINGYIPDGAIDPLQQLPQTIL